MSFSRPSATSDEYTCALVAQVMRDLFWVADMIYWIQSAQMFRLRCFTNQHFEHVKFSPYPGLILRENLIYGFVLSIFRGFFRRVCVVWSWIWNMIFDSSMNQRC